MYEPIIGLTGIAVGAILCSLWELHRTRRSLDQASRDLKADREILQRASSANETLGQELARQRDQLASLEMRLGAAPSRSFTPGR